MKHFFTLISIFLLPTLTSVAQVFDSLDVNNIRAAFTANGGLFQTDSSWAYFRSKSHNRASAVFASSMWLSALDTENNILLSVQKYHLPSDSSMKTDYSYGPIAENDSRYLEADYAQRYNRVWHISKEDINAHRANFNNQIYAPPPSIRDWPAHGDTAKGEPLLLAPFMDLNGNKRYEPLLGEYPLIRGDEAIYMIFNDQRREKGNNYGPSLNAEIHLMAYAIHSASDSFVNNAVFLHYRILNRGSDTLNEIKLGHWNDFDLGFAFDDLNGSDSLHSYGFCYNADVDDEGPIGFGINPPAIALVSIGKAFSGVGGYFNSGVGAVPSVMTDPSTSQEYRNYLNQRWKNGRPIVVENASGCGSMLNGDGYTPSGNSSITRWLYNNQEDWFQPPANTSRDMRLIASQETEHLLPGEAYVFELAYVLVSQPDKASPCPILAAVDSAVTHIRSFFDAQQFPCLGCNVSLEERQPLSFTLFPNPTTGTFYLSAEELLNKLALFDIHGRKVFEQRIDQSKTAQVQLPSSLPAGIYVLQVQSKSGKVQSEKLSKL